MDVGIGTIRDSLCVLRGGWVCGVVALLLAVMTSLAAYIHIHIVPSSALYHLHRIWQTMLEDLFPEIKPDLKTHS